MSDILAAIDMIDRLSGELAIAMQQSAPQIYATLVFIAILTALLFPPMDDPDQI